MLRRPPRLLARALLASVPALALALAFGPAAGASTAQAAAASPSARAAAAARTALEHLDVGQHGADHRVSGHVQKLKGLTQVQSGNWSGYADTGSGYSTVTGKWTEPSASCTSTESLAAFWVGIDGYSSSSVEQDGTLIECYGGTAYYYTWWEMYPTNDIQVVGDTLRPGDSISASVVRSGTSYTLAVTDSSRSGDSFSKKESCSCANSSAEWIAEAPSGSSGVEPLSHFSTFNLSSATVKTTSKSGVISSFTDDEITMVDSSGRVEAQPGALNGSGNAFSVTWERST
jgi:Peptidase A4 family